MFLMTHAVIGASLGFVLPQNPGLAFVFGLASHFIADIIPHGDSNLYKGYVSKIKVRRALAYIGIDAILTIFLVMSLLNGIDQPEVRQAVSLGMAGGILPDLVVAAYEITHLSALRGFHRFHFWIHNTFTRDRGDIPLALGIVGQLGLLSFVVPHLFSLAR